MFSFLTDSFVTTLKTVYIYNELFNLDDSGCEDTPSKLIPPIVLIRFFYF